MPKSNEKFDATESHVFVSGVIAGLISRFVIAPLDVVKIRLQLQAHGPHAALTAIDGPTYRGIVGTMRTIVLQEGIRGLWKGNIPAEFLYMTYGPVQFVALKECTALIKRAAPGVGEEARNFVAGGTAGAVATAATYPFDLLRTRFAAQGSKRVYESIVHSVRHIYEHEGTQGYYRGIGAALVQIVPYMSLFFCCYEATRTYTVDVVHMPEQWSNLVSGGIASTLSKTIVFPFDLVRKRLQVQGPTRSQYVHRNIPAYVGVVGTLRDTVKYEGFRGLYKGLTVSLVKAAPLSAVTMWTMENSLKIMEWIDPSTKGEVD